MPDGTPPPETPEPAIVSFEEDDARPLKQWEGEERDRLLAGLVQVLEALKVLAGAVEGLRPIIRAIRVPGGMEDQLDRLVDGERIPIPARPGKKNRGVPLSKEEWRTIFLMIQRIHRDQWTDSIQDLVTMAIGPEF